MTGGFELELIDKTTKRLLIALGAATAMTPMLLIAFGVYAYEIEQLTFEHLAGGLIMLLLYFSIFGAYIAHELKRETKRIVESNYQLRPSNRAFLFQGLAYGAITAAVAFICSTVYLLITLLMEFL